MEAPTPRPGQMTLWTMQSIAHGADFVSYFRWRTATMGTEIYWHGILDYSGRENRRIAELRDIHEKLQKLAPVAGKRYQAKVALVKDYDNEWDAQLDKWHNRVAWASESALFAAAEHTHTPLDYVYIDHATPEQLAQYKVLFYPHATIMTAERADMLKKYVEEGGTVVFACRSAYKNLTGQCVMDKLPGLLADLTAADIPEYSFIAPDAGTVTIDWNGTTLEANVFADLVEPTEGGVREATYTADYYAGSGALVSHAVGKGTAYYYGTAFNEASAKVFLEKLGVADPCADALSLPEGCELAVRGDESGAYAFVLNYLKTPVAVGVKKPLRDLLTGETVQGERTLPAYGVMVLEL